jgi:hypothetical protein
VQGHGLPVSFESSISWSLCFRWRTIESVRTNPTAHRRRTQKYASSVQCPIVSTGPYVEFACKVPRWCGAYYLWLAAACSPVPGLWPGAPLGSSTASFTPCMGRIGTRTNFRAFPRKYCAAHTRHHTSSLYRRASQLLLPSTTCLCLCVCIGLSYIASQPWALVDARPTNKAGPDQDSIRLHCDHTVPSTTTYS